MAGNARFQDDFDSPIDGSSTRANQPQATTGPSPSTGHRWLMCGVLGASALFSLLFTLTVFLGMAITGTLLAALALGQTDGLDPTVFGGGFWLAVVLGSILIIAGLYLRYQWADDPSKKTARALVQPSVGLLLIFVIPAIILTLLELLGVPIPRIILATTILGAVGYLSLVLPFVLLRVTWRLFVLINRWGQKQVDRANLVIIGSPVALLLGTTFIFGPVFYDDSYPDAALESVSSDLLESAGQQSLTDSVHSIFSGLEESRHEDFTDDFQIEKTAAFEEDLRLAQQRQQLFEACFEELMQSSLFGRSTFKKNIRRLKRDLSSDDAYDLAAKKLADVCEKHSDHLEDSTPYDDLHKVFTKTISNARIDHREKWDRRRELDRDPTLSDSFRPTTPRPSDRVLLRECIEKIPLKHKKVLMLYMHSNDYRELGDTLEISYGAARQRVSRARSALKSECSAWL